MKKKKKSGGKYQQSNREGERGKKIRGEIEEEKEEERQNRGLCHPSPRRSASVSHSSFLMYFCDAWFVCHHPISKHNIHPQARSPAGIWQRTKRSTVNWLLFACIFVHVFFLGGLQRGLVLKGCI